MTLPRNSDGKLHIPDTDTDLPQEVKVGFTKYSDFTPFSEGGTAVLESCLDENLGRVVLIKRLKHDVENDPVEHRRFLREARVTALIQHPNTVPVYTLGMDNRNQPYFTMKRLEGDTLRDIIDGLARKDPTIAAAYPMTRRIEVLLQVCQAVAFAHHRGVIHRDLKPANILIGQFGEVIVLDWGVAKVWDIEDEVLDAAPPTFDAAPHLTRRGNRIGTPLYMSPEQARGRVDLIDERTDVFNMGSILYELLSLQHLVEGTNHVEIIEQIVDRPFVPPRQKSNRSDIHLDLEAICMKALAKEPNDRYPSMQALIDDLLCFQHGDPVSVRPISPFQHWWRKATPQFLREAIGFFLLGILATLVVLQLLEP